MPTPQLQKKGEVKDDNEPVCLFAQTNYRNQLRRFGIKLDDRRRHMYVIGKTGMGKTTMLENMVLHDIYSGHALGVVDPHGDFAEKIIDYIPAHRINDVVYINPADEEFPIGFNILEVEEGGKRHLIAAGLMGVFKKIWPDVWSSRMEYILNNTLLALLYFPGSTLLGINRMYIDKKYRKRVVAKIEDPVVKAFWTGEFASWEDRYRKEAVASIQNKVGQFLSSSVMRNMLAQVKSTINIRQAMDSNKIIIMNLSKGRIGEDNMRLLGGMLITKIQLAAMERVDTLEKDRKDFFLYVDEFQNFATDSFASILSEARKYRLGLIMAHQYIAQLEETVRDAVFGNVGTIVSFRVGAADSLILAPEFAPVFLEEDIVNLSKFNIFLKLMIDGVASQPFSAQTLPPIGASTGSMDKVIRVSRERYGKARDAIEEKVLRWSGMEAEMASIAKKKEKDAEKKKSDTQTTTVDDAAGVSISLKDLLPEGEDAKAASSEVHKEAAPDAPSSAPKTEAPPKEPMEKSDADRTSGKLEDKSDSKEHTAQTNADAASPKTAAPKEKTVSKSESSNRPKEEPKKKKRRRRRKKKGSDATRSENRGGGREPSDNRARQEQKGAKKESTPPSPSDAQSIPPPSRPVPVPPPTEKKPLQPGNIVTFE